MDYDLLIFNFINGLAGHSKILDVMGIFLADWLPYFLGIFLLLFLFWPKQDVVKNRAMVFVAIIAALVARFVVKTIILFFWQRPRPFITLPLAHKLISTSVAENFQSFPSGHAIFFFALAAAIYKFNKKLGIFFLVSSAFISIARIFCGVHWPSDILWGAILGSTVGIAVFHLYRFCGIILKTKGLLFSCQKYF